ncbi:SBBP repeat-containing protein, partial [candidate division KSB1 bacterium]
LLLFTQSIHAQKPLFSWAKGIGGEEGDIGYDIEVDQFGYIYTTGIFSDTVDFDPGPGVYTLISSGSNDIYIQKLSASGDLIWVKKVGGQFNFDSDAIKVDIWGNIYVTGIFYDTVDFNPGPGIYNLSAVGEKDIFILKLDSLGDFIWARKIGGPDNDYVKDIELDITGNIYVLGDFKDTVDFDPDSGVHNIIPIGEKDFFLLKLNSSGNFIWVNNSGAANETVQGRSLAIHSSGDIYSTGLYTGQVDFNPGPGICYLTGSSRTFIQKIDTTGAFLWAKGLFCQSDAIDVDSSGNVVISGIYWDSVDFDPGPNVHMVFSEGAMDIFILKLDSIGNLIWVKSMGGIWQEFVHSITVDVSGSIYTTGIFSYTVDFDPGLNVFNLSTNGNYEIFVQKLDASGNFKWARKWGNYDIGEACNAIKVDASGYIYTTGSFDGICDFDPGSGTFNLTSAGFKDIFVCKWDQCDNSVSSIYPVGCDIYSSPAGSNYISSGIYIETIPNASGCDSIIWIHLTLNNSTSGNMTAIGCNDYYSPSGNFIWTSSGIYKDTISNALGCDSVITVNLSIIPVDTSVVKTGMTLTSNATGATYQWVYCNNNFAIIPGEANQSFTTYKSGKFAVIVNQNGCTDTSSCHQLGNVGIHDHNTRDNYKVYPNPTKGNFTIELNKVYENLEIEISDITGRIINQLTFESTNKINIELDGPKGTYFITIRSNKYNMAFLRILKN